MRFTGKDGELRIYCRTQGYITVHFVNMDFSGPIGRPKREEMLVLDRGIVDEYGHYINGNDMVVFDPLALSFSCFVDDRFHVNTTNGFREVLYEALTCRDARNDQTLESGGQTWNGYGDSTKGTTTVGGVTTPIFNMPIRLDESMTVTAVTSSTIEDTAKTWVTQERADYIAHVVDGVAAGTNYYVTSNDADTLTVVGDPAADGVLPGDTVNLYDNIRTVDIQFKLTGETNDIVWKFGEVYFPPEEITIAEAEDAINMSVNGGVYGAITRHSDWQ